MTWKKWKEHDNRTTAGHRSFLFKKSGTEFPCFTKCNRRVVVQCLPSRLHHLYCLITHPFCFLSTPLVFGIFPTYIYTNIYIYIYIMCVCTYACTGTNYIWIRACRHIYIIHMNLEKNIQPIIKYDFKKNMYNIWEKEQIRIEPHRTEPNRIKEYHITDCHLTRCKKIITSNNTRNKMQYSYHIKKCNLM